MILQCEGAVEHKACTAANQSLIGMALVTSAALLFGVVAAFVKAAALPTLVMLQCRSVIEWTMGTGAALFYRWQKRRKTAEFSLVDLLQINGDVDDGSGSDSSGSNNNAMPTTPPTLKLLLVGPPHLRGWLVLRAFLYWGFLSSFWLALTSMPLGDATTIVYCAPIFTAIFARVFLCEHIDWWFYPVVVLDLVGLVLITQPRFIFPSHSANKFQKHPNYLLGVCGSLASALIGGLLPIITRISKGCFWTAVNHVSSVLSALVFTPVAFIIWVVLDNTALAQTAASLNDFDTQWVYTATHGLGKMPCLLGATVIGFMGLALQTLGYQQTEATKAGMMTILEIPFSYFLQYVLFHDHVTVLGLMGVMLVMAGTLFNLACHMHSEVGSHA